MQWWLKGKSEKWGRRGNWLQMPGPRTSRESCALPFLRTGGPPRCNVSWLLTEGGLDNGIHSICTYPITPDQIQAPLTALGAPGWLTHGRQELRGSLLTIGTGRALPSVCVWDGTFLSTGAKAVVPRKPGGPARPGAWSVSPLCSCQWLLLCSGQATRTARGRRGNLRWGDPTITISYLVTSSNHLKTYWNPSFPRTHYYKLPFSLS